MKNIALLEYVEDIINNYDLCNLNQVTKLNSGFNRAVFNLDNKYILKICVNKDKEQFVKNEISFLSKNNDSYLPKLLIEDQSKDFIPYIYTIEDKINGYNLFSKWDQMSLVDRKKGLSNLVDLLKDIHSKPYDLNYNSFQIVELYMQFLDECIHNGIFTINQIDYLKELSNYMKKYLENTKIGFIHGDIHFNNIIITNEGMKLIDFESCSTSPIDKEFDSINRMVRNPNSFAIDNSNIVYKKEDYNMIMDMFKELYPELCNEEDFDNRLIIYDCLNSIKWINVYPDHEQYHKTLFNDSRKLIK